MANNLLTEEQFNISGASPDLVRESSYEAILHTSSHDFKIELLVSVYVKNDFINDQVSYIEIDGQLAQGDFIKFVYPERETLTLTLIHRTVGELSTTEYVFLLKDVDSDISSNILDTTSLEELNRSFTAFRGQCVPKTFKSLRTKKADGVYKKATVTDVITTLLSDSVSLKTPFGTFSHLQMSPADNTRVYDHVILKSTDNIFLLDVPSYLQEHKTYGVYNGGISTFFNAIGEESLYVFPTHKADTEVSKGTLEIFGLSSTVISTIESSYAMDNDTVKILVKKSDKVNNDDTLNRDSGVSTTSTEANAIISRPYQTEKGKLKLNDEWLINRQAHKKLPDGEAPIEDHGVTGNHYAVRSSVLKQDGILIKLEWKYSNARLLKPMMTVFYTQEVGNTLVRYKGTLQRIDTVTGNNEKVENSLLFIFIKPISGFDGGNTTFKQINNIATSLSKEI
jgi:hypothetical protein